MNLVNGYNRLDMDTFKMDMVDNTGLVGAMKAKALTNLHLERSRGNE